MVWQAGWGNEGLLAQQARRAHSQPGGQHQQLHSSFIPGHASFISHSRSKDSIFKLLREAT